MKEDIILEEAKRFFSMSKFADKENNYEENNHKDTILDSCNPKKIKLYIDLQDAIKCHHQYLHKVEEMRNIPLPRGYLITKRFMDVSVAILGILLLSPLFLIVALLIKIDSKGPVLYGQERVGKNGKLFKIYKFRTMRADAEKQTGPVWATEDDPRITFVGRILRKTKIDEFPQFVNLIKGEMSMVGPRPERPFLVDQFAKIIPGYLHRLDITPGLTGPAQLRNGYNTDAMNVIKKLRYDIFYIKRMNLFMDLRLLVEASISVF
jgi:lipopolysaccharide/colanic/teichoic acid biosynthesis glycosyltransferase